MYGEITDKETDEQMIWFLDASSGSFRSGALAPQKQNICHFTIQKSN